MFEQQRIDDLRLRNDRHAAGWRIFGQAAVLERRNGLTAGHEKLDPDSLPSMVALEHESFTEARLIGKSGAQLRGAGERARLESVGRRPTLVARLRDDGKAHTRESVLQLACTADTHRDRDGYAALCRNGQCRSFVEHALDDV